MGDYHPEAIDWTLAAYGLRPPLLGIALGWMLFSRDADTQEASATGSRSPFSIRCSAASTTWTTWPWAWSVSPRAGWPGR
jgi:hypothetical protein